MQLHLIIILWMILYKNVEIPLHFDCYKWTPDKMEKHVPVILAASLCLCLVYTVVIPECVMDCLSESLPCERECREDYPNNPREMNLCALGCETERAICMAVSDDPACNNKTAINQLPLPFKTIFS
ncbi:uncharacterized protein LOC130052529 [Ostrea edulis]|uniref:uncharacterized protein LOC130052529 n=1 Tax=Ostrea edulis TaxID=37623 RepID=UPI0024AF8509|nr:uncharacterized protein LOC130052529 [Ostrea edulis]